MGCVIRAFNLSSVSLADVDCVYDCIVVLFASVLLGCIYMLCIMVYLWRWLDCVVSVIEKHKFLYAYYCNLFVYLFTNIAMYSLNHVATQIDKQCIQMFEGMDTCDLIRVSNRLRLSLWYYASLKVPLDDKVIVLKMVEYRWLDSSSNIYMTAISLIWYERLESFCNQSEKTTF